MNRSILSLALLLTSLPALGAEELVIDQSHSAVIFSWDHRGYSHPVARFEKISGTVLLDQSDLTRSSVSVSMPLAGLRTGDDALDTRLKRAEFFDLATYPAITFKSSRVETTAANRLKVIGDLSVHGITKSVTLDVIINKIRPVSGSRLSAGFDADVTLSRSDFGMGRYVPMTGDELTVHITLEADQQD